MTRGGLSILPSKNKGKIVLALQIGNYRLGAETTLTELQGLIKDYKKGRLGVRGVTPTDTENPPKDFPPPAADTPTNRDKDVEA